MRAKSLILVMSLLCISFMIASAQGVQIKSSASDVLYRGVKNPVSIVAKGNDGVMPSISDGAKIYSGKVSGFDGQYVVEITDPDVKSVKISFGEATSEFKVQGLPTPAITIGGYKVGDEVPVSVFSKSAQLDAVIDDANFPFKDVKYTVTQFTYMKEADGITSSHVVTGNKIPADILKDIKKKSSGDSIAFIGIKVSTPTGQRNAPGYTAKLK
ncbi:MAG: hypothetical protein II575_01635 [Bacteroidales bacterium]|nr:hypothetical protein [Bacteroidales bacterium]